MIYLIGGPPKCGKTTLAKKLAKKLSIQWVSSDTLQVVARKYVSKYASEKIKELYPHSSMKGKTNDETYTTLTPKGIAKNYIKQARSTYSAIEMFSLCEIKDGNDYIIEGYHVTPQLAQKLIKKHGARHFKVLFLVKSDIEKFLDNIMKSTTPNDWIINKTTNEETFLKIAKMVKYYGDYFKKNAQERNFKVLNMDEDFTKQTKKAIQFLSK
jgi:2-phosphoglycerate kinase